MTVKLWFFDFLQNAISSNTYKDRIKIIIKECIETTGVDGKLVKNSRENGIFADDVKLENYYFCVARKLNFVDEDGNFLPDNVKAVVPPNIDKTKANALIDECVRVTGNRKEQAALLAYKCYKEKGILFV